MEKLLHLPTQNTLIKSSPERINNNSLAEAIMPSLSKMLKISSLLASPIMANPVDPHSLLPIDQAKSRTHFLLHSTVLVLVFCREIIMGLHAFRITNSLDFDDFAKIFSQSVSVILFLITLACIRITVDRGLVCQLVKSWLDVAKHIGK
jgi:hypothetical protein